jgi:hypothetical protein
MAVNPQIASIFAAAYDRMAVMSLAIVRNYDDGFGMSPQQIKLWQRLTKTTKIVRLLSKFIEFNDSGNYVQVVQLSDTEINDLLKYLIKVSDIDDLPVAPKIFYRGYPAIRVSGGPGPQGDAGTSAYVYVGYATNSSGAGYAATPDPSRKYIAVRQSNTTLTVVVGIFAGLWQKYLGDDGTAGAAGAAGVNAFLYVAYASDASGTGFTTTFNSSLKYIGVRRSTTALTPVVGDFAGLWAKYIGENGTNGTNGKTILNGSGVPDDGTVGTDGDFYIDVVAQVIYGPKASGAWGSGTSIIGPAGADGADGDTGDTGPAGDDGADAFVYIAYADDTLGTGFTNSYDPDKEFIAILSTDTEIPSPAVGDFTGLFTRYKGDGDRYKTSSVTSLLIGTGTKYLVVDPDLSYTTGQRVVIALPNDPTNRMEGVVIFYDATTGQMQVAVDTDYGSGTFTTWDVNLIGASAIVVNAWRDCGDYDASTNLFPAAGGGSGPAGIILRFDTFKVIVAGDLGTTDPERANVKSILVCLESEPDQDETKWRII